MIILHCAWIPEPDEDFIQEGDFWLWAERAKEDRPDQDGWHPRQLLRADLIAFLEELTGTKIPPYQRRFNFKTIDLRLPSRNGTPLHELHKIRHRDRPEVELATWQVDAQRLANPVQQLSEISRLHARYKKKSELKLGKDFEFWHGFSSTFQAILLESPCLPHLVYSQPAVGSGEVFAGFKIISREYEQFILESAESMPPICAKVGQVAYEKSSLLRHCAEVLVNRSISRAANSTAVEKKIKGSILAAACCMDKHRTPLSVGDGFEIYRKWQSWFRQLAEPQEQSGFILSFRLCEAEAEDEPWRLDIYVSSANDNTHQLTLADFWLLDGSAKTGMEAIFGAGFESKLLLRLGQAARIYAPLWEGLDGSRPWGIMLNLQQAFGFLQQDAWKLSDAGFEVMVPSWWSNENHKRARIRLQPNSGMNGNSDRRNTLDLANLVDYRCEFVLGGQVIDEAEWTRLVESKTSLVMHRGQWLALDRERMVDILEFWRRASRKNGPLHLYEFIRKEAEDPDFFELEPQQVLTEMLQKLRNNSKLEITNEPRGLQTRLRDYQKRGLSWILFLEKYWLNGCLADDMGLGKTIQVLALLLHEKESGQVLLPTLLVAPTSVIGNWKKEIERFAPGLNSFIHHGNLRVKDREAFKETCQKHDVVITSYALARKDEKLLSVCHWRRVVLDEAQNIKNPLSAQSKSVLRFKSDYRLALTGTPIENRLMDLWSIFNFLNPGYLGKQNHFRQFYESPVQRDNDRDKVEMLKRLIEPFVLRRVKTDPAIIGELPEKVENRQFCNLTLEQASMYEAVVRDAEKRLRNAEGFKRQGLMLTTLTRLKQICNHPAQFLHDGSPFTAERSPKLDRLLAMLDDVINEGESALVFTQFAEIGGQLEIQLRETLGCPVYYLHGAIPAATRVGMITEFQDEAIGPAVFILSLRAGGVGITLTRANHVFHFDRWWNPAVEDQATDRAFRLGQVKNVFVHKFITIGTLEERIDRLIEEKKQVASLIVGSDESWLSRLDNETFRELIQLNEAAVLQ